jgi:hypothetical protein
MPAYESNFKMPENSLMFFAVIETKLKIILLFCSHVHILQKQKCTKFVSLNTQMWLLINNVIIYN